MRNPWTATLAPLALLLSCSIVFAHNGRSGGGHSGSSGHRMSGGGSGSSTFRTMPASPQMHHNPQMHNTHMHNNHSSSSHNSTPSNSQPKVVQKTKTETHSSHHHSGGSHGTNSMPKSPQTVKTPGSTKQVDTKTYASNYGQKFKGGYYYKGHDHQHWTRRYYCPTHSCWCWYCPSTSAWYYWCAPRACYLPVSYIQVAPPAPESEDISQEDLPPEVQSVPNVQRTDRKEKPQIPGEPELLISPAD